MINTSVSVMESSVFRFGQVYISSARDILLKGWQIVQTQIRLLLRSSLIWVYRVCLGILCEYVNIIYVNIILAFQP